MTNKALFATSNTFHKVQTVLLKFWSTKNKSFGYEIKILEQQLKTKDSLISRLAGMEGINLQVKVDVKATNVMGKLNISEITPKLESFLIYSKQEMLNIQDSIKNQKLINKKNSKQ